MATLTFGTTDIVATLAPEEAGGSPVEVTVFAKFGRPRERLVQEICDAIGGSTVYFEFEATSVSKSVVPVANWRLPVMAGGSDSYSNGALVHMADLLKAAVDAGKKVVAYGGQRKRWALSFRMVRGSAARDALDMEPDSAGTPDRGNACPGAMRREF